MTRSEVALEAVRKALPYITHIDVVGSTYIADKQDSDVDVIVMAKGVCSDGQGLEHMQGLGWVYGGSDKGGDGWVSYVRNVQGVEVNLIVVDSLDYYIAWLTSAEVCRLAHLAGHSLPREVVHGVHSIIMDEGEAANEVKRRGL